MGDVLDENAFALNTVSMRTRVESAVARASGMKNEEKLDSRD